MADAAGPAPIMFWTRVSHRALDLWHVENEIMGFGEVRIRLWFPCLRFDRSPFVLMSTRRQYIAISLAFSFRRSLHLELIVKALTIFAMIKYD